jgi:hypothetical protein
MRRTQASLPVGLRAELLYLVMGFIETLWITPFVMLFLPGSLSIPGYQNALIVAVHLLGSLMILRLVNNQNKADMLPRLLGVVVIGAGMLFVSRAFLPEAALDFTMPRTVSGRLGYPPAIITLIIIGILWFRGSRLATITVTPLRASFALRLGIVALMFAALIPDPRTQRAVLLLLPLFFFFGLMGVALARSASLRLNREVYQSTFGVSWVVLTFTIGAALTIFGFISALVLSGFHFDSIVDAFSNVLTAMVAVVATFIGPIVQAFIDLLKRLFPTLNLINNLPGSPDEDPARIIKNASTSNLADQIAAALPMICLSMVLILLFILVLLRLRMRRSLNLRDGEERETVAGENLLKILQAALSNGLQNLGDRLAELNPFASREELTALTIRRLYARLGRLGASAGNPRQPQQTPREYRATLAQLWPAYETEIGELTMAYVEVHYGELPDDPTILQRARAMLEQIEQIERERKKAAPSGSGHLTKETSKIEF